MERKIPSELRIKSLFSSPRNTKPERLMISNIYRQNNFEISGHCKYPFKNLTIIVEAPRSALSVTH